MALNLKKHHKSIKIKLIIIVITIYLSFVYTFYYSFQNIKNNSNEAFIKYLINNGILYEEKYNLPKVINKSFNYILKIDITKPITLFNGTIFSYKNNSDEENIDLEKVKAISNYLEDPSKKEIKNPIIYLYNSHQLENYNNDSLAKFGITPNVLMMSYLLKEKLNEKNIPTIIEDTNITDFLSINNWDYSSSYKASRIFLLDKLNTYPTIKYFIDIHRDSVGRDITTTTINGIKYAKILFVIGLEHDNYAKNLEVTNNINDLFNKYYPGISRGILKKEGPGVNGIYNQDISPNVILIEVGGVDNNTSEVMNTMNAVTDILVKYIGDDHEK